MAIWCNYYNCFCNDLEMIIEKDNIECDEDCKNCEHREELTYSDEYWW